MDIFVRALSSGLMVLFPLGLWLAMSRRFRMGLRLVGAGALTFVASQVLHLPFNAWGLSRIFEVLGLESAPRGQAMVLAALLLGLSAGVFEESARYLVYRFWLKDARTWRQAVLFGAGHGGIEAILLGALALLTLFQMASLRNVDLATVVPAEQLELARQQMQAYWAASWSEALLPALERALAVMLHISLAVTVLQALVRRNAGWLVLAIGWHAVANAAGLLALEWWGAYAAEGVIAVVVLGALGLAWRLRRPGEEGPAEAVVPLRPTLSRKEPPLRHERLDDSRYLD
ncbi:MAG: YhfC family glutamic-type intramembrane protease [Chloroflexota bacterium]